MEILTAQQLSKIYGSGETQVTALRDVNLSVQTGEFIAIFGPSGSGKSTLLNVLSGLEFPTSGRVLIEGQELATMDDDRRTVFRRRRIGFVFQRFNLLPHMTAIQNVALPLLLDGLALAQRSARAEAMLGQVGMSHRAGNTPRTMSGGEQQRVAIARALVTGPALILADEPTGMLDSQNSQNVILLLRKLVTEQQHTVVMVTHDAWAASQADRRVQVRDGVVTEGNP